MRVVVALNWKRRSQTTTGSKSSNALKRFPRSTDSGAAGEAVGVWHRWQMRCAVGPIGWSFILSPRGLDSLAGRSSAFLLFLHTARSTCGAKGRYLPRSQGSCERVPGVGCWYGHWRDGCLSGHGGRRLWWTCWRRQRWDTPAALSLPAQPDSFLIVRPYRTCSSARRRGSRPGPRTSPANDHACCAPRPRGRDLLFLGRYLNQKGLSDAVRVAAALPGRCLRLFGSGPGPSRRTRTGAGTGRHERTFMIGVTRKPSPSPWPRPVACCCRRVLRSLGHGWPGGDRSRLSGGSLRSGRYPEWLHPEYGECVAQGDVAALVEAARRQLARVDAGLDTSHWRQAAEENWGNGGFRPALCRFGRRGPIRARRQIKMEFDDLLASRRLLAIGAMPTT